ncbi:MAG TPA: Holliday junction branch migration protein RuvA [Candidatus Acidoferrales bacterium]|nr:Holliday junction branch migration protein RuvA [Candidatus Acidoferrales bacterium]
MIYRITGRLAAKNPTMLVVEVNGLSYEVNVPLSTYERVGRESSEVSLYTILVVREDDLQLYGFATEDERKLFKLLTSVSGIGPRTALSLLSSANVGDIFGFIANSNLQALTSIPGIGKKTAERVVLELRDKVLKLDVGVLHEALEGKEEIRSEAVDALLALGYSRIQSEKAVREALKNDSSAANSVEELVRSALKEVK